MLCHRRDYDTGNLLQLVRLRQDKSQPTSSLGFPNESCIYNTSCPGGNPLLWPTGILRVGVELTLIRIYVIISILCYSVSYHLKADQMFHSRLCCLWQMLQ